MSHTMNIKLELCDQEAVKAAAERLGIRVDSETKTHAIYMTTKSGKAIFFNNWKFPAVLQEDGSIAYDNYNGAWGNIDRLNEFVAYYGLEKAKIEARKKGYSVIEGLNEETKELELTICVEE